MKNISRRILVGALSLIILNSACGALTRTTPAPVGTILPDDPLQTIAPTSTTVSMTNTSIVPLIPITGENVVSMQCQFCVDTDVHAVLVFPDFAFFDVASSAPVTCLTAQVVNGQRVLICRGAESTSFTLNICSDPSNCLQFPVTLESCPLLPTGTGTPRITFTPRPPYFLNPNNTLVPPTNEPPLQPTDTLLPTQQTTAVPPTAPVATPTPTQPPSTDPPPPTETEPPPTEEPPPPDPTDPPSDPGGGDKKPTKTPKPKPNSK